MLIFSIIGNLYSGWLGFKLLMSNDVDIEKELVALLMPLVFIWGKVFGEVR